MVNKKGRAVIIAVVVIFTSILVWQFSQSLFRYTDDETLSVSRTAISLMPPLVDLRITNDDLLGAFPEDVSKSIEKRQPSDLVVLNNLKRRVSFDGEQLICNDSFRQYLDELLLLYPSFSMQQIRYLIAKEMIKLDESSAKVRFVLFDQVFIKYVNLSREIEALDIDDLKYKDLSKRFEEIKRLRREYLGETLANAFFAKQEAYLKKEIFTDNK